MEGATPITTITADELAKSGFATVGDALRSSNLNAFGSWGGGSNNGWGSQATVQLKGASAFNTLTLLDGKRMAKSPVLDGGAANINTIPMAAVERIEILTDGASAIYGTDAIAGVVNIILKKDFEVSSSTVVWTGPAMKAVSPPICRSPVDSIPIRATWCSPLNTMSRNPSCSRSAGLPNPL